ncbi:MAG: NosD domain-containing protein [Candidatus Thorarchaeota archaeon]
MSSILLLISLVISPPLQTVVAQESTMAPSVQVTTSATNYTDHEPIEIIGDDDFAVQYWPGNGTWGDPYRIENLNISSEVKWAVTIINVSVPFIISNCFLETTSAVNEASALYMQNVSSVGLYNSSFSGGEHAIHTEDCRDIEMVDSIVMGGYDGIWVEYGYNVTISENTFQLNEGTGVLLWPVTMSRITGNLFVDSAECIGAYMADDTIIEDNVFVECGLGIGLIPGGLNLTIQGNTFTNLSGGIDADTVFGSRSSMSMTSSSYPPLARIIENSFVACRISYSSSSSNPYLFLNNSIQQSEIGVALLYADSNLIINNTIIGSSEYGIRSSDSNFNRIFGNTLSDSGIANAIDTGTSNVWDNGIDQGNFWSDYDGGGLYEIPGSANSVDRWPERVGPPFLWVVNETEIIEGASGLELTWKAYDANPLSYEITSNGTIIESGPWDGRNITISLDGLEVGTYNFTVTVIDIERTSSTAAAIVRVLKVQNLWLPVLVVMATICLSAIAVALRKRK